MSAKRAKSTPPMALISTAAKVVWTTAAITAEDPAIFAEDLGRTLQRLTDQGYAIINQMTRGAALIVTAQKILQVQAPVSPPQPVVMTSLSFPSTGARAASQEVLYHYVEWGTQKQLRFTSMAEALRLVRIHLSDDSQPRDILPLDISVMTVESYDAKLIPALLREYAKELQPDKKME
jgi:hypothetical protein